LAQKKVQRTLGICCIIPATPGFFENGTHKIDNYHVMDVMIHWFEVRFDRRGQVGFLIHNENIPKFIVVGSNNESLKCTQDRKAAFMCGPLFSEQANNDTSGEGVICIGQNQIVSLSDTPLGNHEDSFIAKSVVVCNIIKESLTKAVISGRAVNLN
jgi:hypothetical protein